MKGKIKLLSALLCLSAIACTDKGVSIDRPKVEMQQSPLGIDIRKPTFTWQLRSMQKDVIQTTYEIQLARSESELGTSLAGTWNSGEVKSDQMKAVYEGDRLTSQSDYFWRVRVHTNRGTTPWSKAQRFSTGVAGNEEWKGKWIGEDAMSNPGETRTDLHTRLAARYLRKEFDCTDKVRRAMLYISGLGYYEAYINGQPVSEDMLTPSITFYSETTFYNTYDVTHLLNDGTNAIGVTLGNGRYFWIRGSGVEGFGLPRLLAQLELEYEDGSVRTITTDETWKVTSKGPIIANNEFDGEDYDASREMKGWNRVGYNDANWKRADLMSAPGGVLRSQPCPSVRVMERIRPVSVTRVADGKYLVDMGQNMVGRLRVRLKGKAGRTVTMRFAELLNPDSTLFVANLRTAQATNHYIPADDKRFEWAPTFVYHGFRYAEIDGVEGEPSVKDFTGEVMYDRMETIGRFETSNPVINQVFRNAYWGIRGNYHNMPTDCPQRDERHGWLGDRATGCWGESFVFDNALLYRKWLKDIEESQREDGVVSAVSPRYWTIYAGDVTWPSAYLLAADMLYRHFGDERAIVERYPSMKRWVEYIFRESMTDSVVTRDEWGDWCVPPESPELIHSQDPLRKTDGAILSTTTFYGLLHKMAEFAPIAGHPEDTVEYLTRAKALKEAYNRRYFDPSTAQYGNNSVTGNLLSLRHGLVPEGYEQRVFDNVVRKTETDCGGHVSAGVVGIQHLMRGLTEYGRKDMAYRIATETEYPSWGYMIKKGATTIWELWNGDTAAPDMNSANHVMLLGDLLIWYYEDLAGIKNAEGSTAFRHIDMSPCFPDGLEWVNASYRSVSGLIGSHWRRSDDGFTWRVTIPANCKATVRIPLSLHPSKPEEKDAHSVTQEGDHWVVELGSGVYTFSDKAGR